MDENTMDGISLRDLVLEMRTDVKGIAEEIRRVHDEQTDLKFRIKSLEGQGLEHRIETLEGDDKILQVANATKVSLTRNLREWVQLIAPLFVSIVALFISYLAFLRMPAAPHQ